MATKTHFEWLILTDIDTNTIIQYNLRYTQEFGDGYSDDWFVLLKELEILRNSEMGHFAYSAFAI